MAFPHHSGGGVKAPSPLDLLSLGLPIFPVAGKKPTGSWKRFQDELPSVNEVKDWLRTGSDFGLATGRIAGVVVVDTDSPDAEDWAARNLPETPWQVLTGIKDAETGFRGRHRYYRYPTDGTEPRNTARVNVGGKKLQLDIRGHGGYVVAPGAHHESGVRYTATRNWEPEDRALLPEFRVDWFDSPSIPEPSIEFAGPPQNDNSLSRAKAWLDMRDPAVQGQGGDHHTYVTVCHLVDFRLSDSEILEILEPWNARCIPPWSCEQLTEKVVNARKYGRGGEKGPDHYRRVRPDTGANQFADDDSAEDSGRITQFQKLVAVAEELFPFFTCDGVPYLSPGDSLAIQLESKKAEQFLRWAYYQKTGEAVGGENLAKFIGIKAAELAIEGQSAPVFRRVGQVGETYYLDLCHDGKVVVTTADGWTIKQNPEDVYFLRSGAEEEALPIPEPGGDVTLLRKIVNVNDEDYRLMTGCMVDTLRPRTPKPVLVIEGEAGSGKSTTCRVLKFCIDPGKELLRAFPASERDFAVYAHNSHVMTLDNIDRITPGQSDMLCRASTGGAFSARTHYTMTEETVIGILRFLILTGIHGLVDRADLADRVILITLNRVEESRRIPESELWPLAEKVRPQVLGGLLDALVAGLRNLSKVKLGKLPRMADWAKFVTAAESGLPWEQGEILRAYRSAKGELFQQALEKDRIALAVHNLMAREKSFGRSEWKGTASELLAELEPPFGHEGQWPRKPSTLVIRLTKAAPLLRAAGISLSRDRNNKSRTITLYLSPPDPSHPSHPSRGAEELNNHAGFTGDGLSDGSDPSVTGTRHAGDGVTGPGDGSTLNPSLIEAHNHADGDGCDGCDGYDGETSSASFPDPMEDLGERLPL